MVEIYSHFKYMTIHNMRTLTLCLIFIIQAMLESKRLGAVLMQMKTTSFSYNFILLPGNLMQVIVVDLDTKETSQTIYGFEELDSVTRSQFKDCQELFQAIQTSTARSLEMDKKSKKALTVFFETDTRLNTIHFVLQPRRPSQQDQEQSKENDFRRQLEQVCSQNKRLVIENNRLETRITELDIELRLTKYNLQNTRKQLKRLEGQVKERQFHQRQEDSFVTRLPQKMTYRVPLKSHDYNAELLPKQQLNPFKFVPYNTLFLKNFSINGSRLRIDKEFKDFYQVASETPIPLVGKTKVTIKVIHSRLTRIYFGVIKDSRRKQKYTCQHKESISYKLRGGKFLFEDGIQTGEQIPWVKEGETLQMSIDRQSSEVTWFIQDSFMIKRRIPSTMQKQPLYVFVSMHDEGDEVEIV